MRKYTFLALLAASFASSACSMMPDWVGDKNAPKLEGERVTVLKLENRLSPDIKLQQVEVQLPPAEEDNGNLTGIGQYIAYRHLPLSSDLRQKTTISFGSGEGDSEYMVSVPLVVDNKIFLIDGRGSVSAYDADKRKKLWNVTLKLPKKKHFAPGAMAYSDGKLVISTGLNAVVALDASDGKQLWQQEVGNIVRSAPLVERGRIFVITIDNQMISLDLNDGKQLWTHTGSAENVGMYGSASPVTSQGVVLAPYSSGELFAIDGGNGREIWTVNLAYSKASASMFSLSDIDIAPIMQGRVILTASNAGMLLALDVVSSRPLWQQEIVGVQGMWLAGSFLYVLNQNNELICLHAQDGRIKWVKELPLYKDAKDKKGRITMRGPVLAGDDLLISASSGKLLLVSPYDGNIRQEIKIPERVTLPPVVSKNSIYLVSNDAKLTVIH